MLSSVLISSDSAGSFSSAPYRRIMGGCFFGDRSLYSKRLSNTGAWAKCFSVISPMLCHADSRLEQNGCFALILRENRVQERERTRPGGGQREREREAWAKESLAVMLALSQVLLTRSHLKQEMKKWIELIYNNQNWKRLKQKKRREKPARYCKGKGNKR